MGDSTANWIYDARPETEKLKDRVRFLEDMLEKLAYEVYSIRSGQTQSTHEWVDSSDADAYDIWDKLRTRNRFI